MTPEIVIGAVAIIISVLGSSWRLSGQIKGIQSRVDALTERLDRVNVEQLRDRVTRLDVRMDAIEHRCDKEHG